LKKIVLTLICLTFLTPLKAETLISVVIPFSAGGATDQLWRVIEPHLNKRLQPRGIRLITENIPGAGGTIGTNRVATSEKPMLGFFSPAFAISPNTLHD
jgi:tripartite-type tricarboxylate transporter receptor subunit TctC